MTGETHFRACCSDARERRGAAAPLLSDAIGKFIPADLELPEVPAALVRQPANAARHEVAHVLVTLALGGTVGKVTIEGQGCAEVRLPDMAPWTHTVAVDLAGDAATVGDLTASDLDWHVRAVRNCGGGRCDRCNAVRSLVVGLRHPPNEAVIAEFRRIEATLAAFFSRPEIRELVFELSWWLGDVGAITGSEIIERAGPLVRALHLEI